MPKDFLFTSESVNEGHPDKVCDQIADAVLDSLLVQDPEFTWERTDKVDVLKKEAGL